MLTTGTRGGVTSRSTYVLVLYCRTDQLLYVLDLDLDLDQTAHNCNWVDAVFPQ